MSFEPADGVRKYKPKVVIDEDPPKEHEFIETDVRSEKSIKKEYEPEEKEIVVIEKPTSNVGLWIALFIIIICNGIAIIYFVPVCLAASSKVETNLLQHYKLWSTPHDTLSSELDLFKGQDREIASILQSALSAVGNGHACICMHHLALSAEYGSRRACMVQGILMPNPTLKGTGSTVNPWRQWSVSCTTNPITRNRYESIYVEWDDMHTNEKHWIRFNGIQSACMQLALEEMDGKVKCSD